MFPNIHGFISTYKLLISCTSGGHRLVTPNLPRPATMHSPSPSRTWPLSPMCGPSSTAAGSLWTQWDKSKLWPVVKVITWEWTSRHVFFLMTSIYHPNIYDYNWLYIYIYMSQGWLIIQKIVVQSSAAIWGVFSPIHSPSYWIALREHLHRKPFLFSLMPIKNWLNSCRVSNEFDDRVKNLDSMLVKGSILTGWWCTYSTYPSEKIWVC